MTKICPRCGQTIDQENDVPGTFKYLLKKMRQRRILGLWGEIGYVTMDDLNKRKRIELDADTTDKVVQFLELIEYHEQA